MSHLTAAPFNKPSPLDLPRAVHPMSPPDTDYEYVAPNTRSLDSGPAALGFDLDPAPSFISGSVTETPGPRRKLAALTYINSGPRESRDKTVQRSLKWLIVVIPPASFSREHGNLGTTLSSGPHERLSNGILMPLFPTMNGQLGAIAREFCLPSTAGLCLYLHASHGGSTMTPRISDESWHLLWDHFFDARSPTVLSQSLPIGGRIEFDIDLRRARWYDAWLSSARRDAVDVPQSVVPSRAPTLSHWRGDSRTSIMDDQADDQLENAPFMPHHRSSPSFSKTPKKLSLLDRFDTLSTRSGSRLVPRNLSPPSPRLDSQMVHALSPIVQESEPKTARKDIDNLVNSWRASASLSPAPLAATGQTSLDPINMPNAVPLEDTAGSSPVHSEFNLDDFTWSISSAGPPEYEEDNESIISSDRVPSVHLDRRMQGSVCLTESYCTSWGAPSEYDESYSPVSNVSRLPSPDLAWRMLDDAPPTPSTATSWGPPSYPPSIPGDYNDHAYHHAPSIDIARRFMGSRPVTPSTATSWGPSSWPVSPALTDFRVRSPDVGDRGEFSRPVTPSTATSWGPPSYPPSPIISERAPTPDIGERAFDIDGPPIVPVAAPVAQPQPWKLVWPYNMRAAQPPKTATGTQSPYAFAFPYYATPDSSAEDPVAGPSSPDGSEDAVDTGPWSQTWTQTWTYNETEGELEPEFNPDESDSEEDVPGADPWTQVWPLDEEIHEATEATTAIVAPAQGNTWPHVWPYQEHHDIITRESTHYPYLDLYPAVYPHFDLYPMIQSVEVLHDIQMEMQYPVLNIYPASYPHFDIYPAILNVVREYDQVYTSMPEPVPIKLTIRIPIHFSDPAVYPGHLEELYPPIYASTATSPSVAVILSPVYPTFDIYSPVYPYNLENIYSSARVSMPVASSPREVVTRSAAQNASPSSLLSSPYPVFNLYPPVPTRSSTGVYHSLTGTDCVSAMIGSVHTAIDVRLSSSYPAFDLYTAVYPHNLEDVYPQMSAAQHLEPSSAIQIIIRLHKEYPVIDLYDSVYPWNLHEIYPNTHYSFSKKVPEKQVTERSVRYMSYPTFDLYPSVYPWNVYDIYPQVYPMVRSSQQEKLEVNNINVHLSSCYPIFSIYPAVYPWNINAIYPAVAVENPVHNSINVHLPLRYPHIELYRTVYPHNLHNLYPSLGDPGNVDQKNTLPRALRQQSTSSPARSSIRSHVRQYATRSSLTKLKENIPPVPPLPQSKHAIGTASFEGALPVHLQSAYPSINPYPDVYPYFDIYPEIVASSIPGQSLPVMVKLEASYPLLEIYPPVYPYLDLYPSPSGGIEPYPLLPSTQPPKRAHLQASVSTEAPDDSERTRRPRYSHAELHQQVFKYKVNQPVMNLPTLDIPPAVPSPHSRMRSGTVNLTPDISVVPTDEPPVTISPAIASAQAALVQGVTQPRIHGLPAHPAVGRRMSNAFARPVSYSSPPGAAKPVVRSAGDVANFPSNRPVSPEASRHSGSSSATLPRTLAPPSGADLSRAKTLPSRPGSRPSAVLERARAYDASGANTIVEETPVRITMAALAQFPKPPLPPLPTTPPARTVSKLDISKYPFA